MSSLSIGDLFPTKYIDELNQFTNSLDPMSEDMINAITKQELLQDGERFKDVFEFDEEPLGAASIAQVHRAVLSKKYGAHKCAVKIQRRQIESKLMGAFANLKLITKLACYANLLPVDYYAAFFFCLKCNWKMNLTFVRKKRQWIASTALLQCH
jgi:aarF domain-containing kinase